MNLAPLAPADDTEHLSAAALQLAQTFAAQVREWASRHSKAAAALRLAQDAAFAVSAATASGHVCIPLSAVREAPWAETARQLQALGIAGTAADPVRPLLIDARGRLYLTRYYRYECQLAAALQRLAQPRPALAPVAAQAAALLSAFGHASPPSPVDRQMLAAALALYRGLVVVSGGPGSGKTHTVLALLNTLLSIAPHSRIALAAPTGKAAARLIESLRQRAEALPAAVRAALPEHAHTVHHLLGTQADGSFRHHRDNPLPFELVVIDEASMLDLALATHLLAAVPRSARLVLLGDKDQLAAVEAGAVFAELSAAAGLSQATCAALSALCGPAISTLQHSSTQSAPALADSVVWLNESHRFASDSGIGRCARAIRDGDAESLLAQLAAAPETGELQWLRPPAGNAEGPGGPTLQQGLLAGYAAYLACLSAPDTHINDCFLAFESFRVLCALHEGAQGVSAINQLVAQRVRATLGSGGSAAWYPGRAVMVTRNDAALGLFNGDIGLYLVGADGQAQVFFRAREAGLRGILPARLPPHVDAYAMTVHKSQGSEFASVMVLLPTRDSPVLSRELLYTAVTRARQRLLLVADADTLRQTLARRSERRSGLADRLADAALSAQGD